MIFSIPNSLTIANNNQCKNLFINVLMWLSVDGFYTQSKQQSFVFAFHLDKANEATRTIRDLFPQLVDKYSKPDLQYFTATA
jgi:hypothetical protein